MSKILSVAIIGVGSRGADSYGKYMNEQSDRFNIVALCDIRPQKVERFKVEFNVKEENCFTDENEFFKKKLADVLIIATQDRDHVRHCLKGLELGYDILLEKPVTPFLEECYELLAAQEKYGGRVVVCHVLRYAPAYSKIDSLLKEGAIGKLVNIHAVEHVGYWHQAHSFVRGNWRKEETTSPMILAKCCHDLDLIQHFAGSTAKDISSIGSLAFFKKENQPEGASDRCSTCKYKSTCPYSAYRIYIERWKDNNSPSSMWPQNVITDVAILTEEALEKAIKETYYGQCVFACDNNVVDNQETNILFNNGVTANLLMTGFSHTVARCYTFHGTHGELVLDEERGTIYIKKFGEPVQEIAISSIADLNGGHGGGDVAMMNDLYDSFALNKPTLTTLKESLESHIIALKAEINRKSKI